MYKEALLVAESFTQEELLSTIRWTSDATLRAACREILKHREEFQK